MHPLIKNNLSSLKLFLTILMVAFTVQNISASVGLESDTVRTKKNFFKFLSKPYMFNYSGLSQLYPTRDNPSVGLISSYKNGEKAYCEVRPSLTLNVYNDFKAKLNKGKLFSQGYSVAFRTQLRMYNEDSAPIKMPSYHITLGLQHLYRLNSNHFVAYSLESGHYSNGQNGSTFIGGGKDRSAQSDSVWALITPNTNLSEVINRENGNFSTNLSELIINYRFIPKYDVNNKPQQIHSFSAGAVLYHYRLFGMVISGGYSNNAVSVYGRWRYLFSYEYSYHFKTGYRLYISESVEIIQNPHPWINPVRSLLQISFFLPQPIGFYINYAYGHDDYNLRLVDSGHRFGAGLTWDIFAPIQIVKVQK